MLVRIDKALPFPARIPCPCPCPCPCPNKKLIIWQFSWCWFSQCKVFRSNEAVENAKFTYGYATYHNSAVICYWVHRFNMADHLIWARAGARARAGLAAPLRGPPDTTSYGGGGSLKICSSAKSCRLITSCCSRCSRIWESMVVAF